MLNDKNYLILIVVILIFSILTNNISFFIFSIIILLIIRYLNEIQNIYNKKDKYLESFNFNRIFKEPKLIKQKIVYEKPSYENPFMNLNLIQNPDKATFQNSFEKKNANYYQLEDKIEECYEKHHPNPSPLNLKDSDIQGRQFYSVPGNTIPNRQNEFANWLYKTPPTCKEGNPIQCAQNIPQRLMNNIY